MNAKALNYGWSLLIAGGAPFSVIAVTEAADRRWTVLRMKDDWQWDFPIRAIDL